MGIYYIYSIDICIIHYIYSYIIKQKSDLDGNQLLRWCLGNSKNNNYGYLPKHFSYKMTFFVQKEIHFSILNLNFFLQANFLVKEIY